MTPSKNIAIKLDQIEQELTTAISEYPSQVGPDRLKFARALVRFIKAELDRRDDDATVPVSVDFGQRREAANSSE